MSEQTSYAPGTPSWVDLGSPDPDASARFYGGLFGWETTEAGPPEAGGYRMFTLRGKLVAGVGPLQAEGQPPAWSTYVSVDDADAVAARVGEAGGTVVMAPMDVLTAGRMAFFSDSVGAMLGVWQPRDHIGAQLVNEPGTLGWNELACRDIEAPKAFYGAVFGWEAETNPMDGTTYTEWKLGGHPVGGMIQMDEHWPAEVPPHWMVYFAVADCDASAAKAAELGGTVSVPPTTIAPGRFAVLGDPHGAFFSILTLTETPA